MLGVCSQDRRQRPDLLSRRRFVEKIHDFLRRQFRSGFILRVRLHGKEIPERTVRIRTRCLQHLDLRRFPLVVRLHPEIDQPLEARAHLVRILKGSGRVVHQFRKLFGIQLVRIVGGQLFQIHPRFDVVLQRDVRLHPHDRLGAGRQGDRDLHAVDQGIRIDVFLEEKARLHETEKGRDQKCKHQKHGQHRAALLLFLWGHGRLPLRHPAHDLIPVRLLLPADRLRRLIRLRRSSRLRRLIRLRGHRDESLSAVRAEGRLIFHSAAAVSAKLRHEDLLSECRRSRPKGRAGSLKLPLLQDNNA